MVKRTGLNKNVSTIFRDLPELEDQQKKDQASKKPAEKTSAVITQDFSKKVKKDFQIASLFHKTSIGIYISQSSIKLMVLQSSKSRSIVTTIAESRLAEDDYYKSLTKTLRQMSKQSGIRADSHVNIVIEHPKIKTHYLSIPKVQHKKMHETIMWELSKISHVPLDSSFMDFRILDDPSLREGQIRIACVVTPLEMIRNIAASVESIGLAIRYIIPVPSALENFINLFLPANKKEHSIMLNLETDISTICFFRGTTLQYSRQILIGKKDFITALNTPIKLEEKLINLNDESADTILSTVGIPLEEKDSFHSPEFTIPHHHLLSLIRPVLEKLINEIQLSTNFYRNNYNASSFTHFLVSGEIGALRNLDKLVIKTLGVAPELVNPFSIANIEISGSLPPEIQKKTYAYTALLGTSLRPSHSINMLPKEIKLKQTVKRVRTSMNILFIGSMALMLLLFGAFKIYTNRMNVILSTSRANILPLEKAEKKIYLYHVLKNENLKKEEVLNQLRHESTRWDNILVEISRLTPDGISLTEINGLNNNTLTINGEYISRFETKEPAISQFLVNLKNSPLFKQIKLNTSEKKMKEWKNEITYFQITCQLETGLNS